MPCFNCKQETRLKTLKHKSHGPELRPLKKHVDVLDNLVIVMDNQQNELSYKNCLQRLAKDEL